MKEVNTTLNGKDIEDLQTILDNAEAYADTHDLRTPSDAAGSPQNHPYPTSQKKSHPITNKSWKKT